MHEQARKGQRRTHVEAIAAVSLGLDRLDAFEPATRQRQAEDVHGRDRPAQLARVDVQVEVERDQPESLAHAGLRLGWTVAPEALVAELMERQDYTTIGTGPMNQFVAARLLEPQGRARILSRTRSIIAANLHIIEAWIGRWNGRLSYRRPDAGGMAFVRYDWPIGSAELSRIARERESVFVVAGEWFGMDGHLRIGTGGEPHVLEEGLARLDRLFATL